MCGTAQFKLDHTRVLVQLLEKLVRKLASAHKRTIHSMYSILVMNCMQVKRARSVVYFTCEQSRYV